MAIEFECSGCSSTLRVPDEHSGKHARCPKCSTVNAIPANSGNSAGHMTGSSNAPSAPEPYKATAAGLDLFGSLENNSQSNESPPYPVDYSAGSSVDYSQYTQPNPDPSGSPSPSYDPSSGSSNYYSTEGYSTEGYTTSSYSSGYGPTSHLLPHRGGAILTLGLLSLFCNFLLIPGVMAWVMGSDDLKQIRAGTMNPDGRGLATAGMILGAIGTVIGICFIAFAAASIFIGLNRAL